MIKTELIFPEQLTAEDIRWMRIGCRDSIDEFQVSDLIDAAMTGKSGIYRVSGDTNGVFILTKAGDRMEISTLAGKGFIRHFDAVHDAILLAAAGCGAKAVSGYTQRAGLAALYKKRTKARFAEYFVEELP